MGLNVFILRYQISIWSLKKTFKGEYIQEKILTFASVGNLLLQGAEIPIQTLQ